MMRIEVFSTLIITNSTNFVKSHHDADEIKHGIVEFSIKDKIRALQKTEMLQKCSDWQDILYDKCLDNQLTDVHIENATPQDFDNFYNETLLYMQDHVYPWEARLNKHEKGGKIRKWFMTWTTDARLCK